MRVLPALLLAALTVPALAAETTHSDDWYAVYVNETKTGHAHTEVVRIEDDTAAVPVRWVTTSTTEMTLLKSGASIDLRLSSRLEEDAEGRVLSYRQVQKTSGREMVTEGRVEGDTVHLTRNGVAGEVPYPAGALGPAATDRLVRAAGFDTGTETKVIGFDVDNPAIGSRRVFTCVGDESKRVMDRRLRLHGTSVENSASAARSMFMWHDGTGRMHVSETDLPGLGIFRLVRTTEALAKSVSRPAEVFAASLIEPDRGIAGPRRAKHAVLRFSRKDGEPFDAHIYEGEGQTTTPTEGNAALDVTVEAWTPPEGFRADRLPIARPGLAPYLVKAAHLETDDAKLRTLARKAVGDEKDALAAARRIEAFVRSYVTNEHGDVGYASAAEVAESGQGDCTEHAMLTAALARVVGLPSRVVRGLVYVPGLSAAGIGPRGAFGFHMWTEVLVAEDRWLPLDSALGGFDATHVAMGKSDLATTSPSTQLSLPLLEAIASLQIQIMEVR